MQKHILKSSKRGFGVISVTVIIVLAAALLLTSFAEGRISAVAEAAWQPVEISDGYEYGTVFTAPERNVTYNGKTVSAAVSIRLPDGTVTSLKQVTLDRSGIYTVIYVAEIDGNKFVAEEKFTVIDNLYNLTDGKSSATYGTHMYGGATTGLVVRLAENDSLSFTQLIDMKSLDKTKTLIKAFVTPDEIRTLDFNKLVFTFKDSLDPDIYLTIWAMQSGEGVNKSATYYSAGGQNQPVCGLEGSKLHINDGYGPATVHSFYGNYSGDVMPPDLSKRQFILSYDYESNSVYCGQNSAGEKFVIDLDSYDYFNNMWSGFPSGKAYLSVSAAGYSGSNTANFVITQLFGIDLKKETFIGHGAPVITIDNDYATMPEARIGESYPVPSATAQDEYDGAVNVSVNVLYNYNTSTPFNVTIDDGKFLTARRGYYAIVYRAVNSRGKTSERVLWVHAGNDIEKLKVNIDKNDVNYEKPAVLGVVSAPAACNPSGGSGNLTVKITARNGAVELSADRGFRPEIAGTWTITYTVTDYTGAVAEDSYTVEAKAGDTMVFVDEPELPEYLIAGSEYCFPVLYANDYRSGTLTRVPASFTVSDASGVKEYEAGEAFTPTVNENFDTVTITYKADGVTASYPIKAVRAFVNEDGRSRLHAENYFDAYGTRIVKTNDYIQIDATAKESGWTYANMLLAPDFSFTFSFVPAAADFSGINFVMTDSADRSISLESRIVERDGKVYFESQNKSVLLDLNFRSNDKLTFTYSDGSISLGVNEIALENFVGFPSNRMYFSVSFADASAGSASYRIYNLDNQIMNNSTLDLNAPRIAILGDYGGTVSLGSTITLPAAVAGDVFDPRIKFVLTVKAPDGSVVTDIAGNVLNGVDPSKEYTIDITMYGQYQVSYTATDTFRNNRQPLPYAISVYDEIAPEITVKGAVTEATVGDFIALPEISVTDNVTSAENIIVSVMVSTPDGQIVYIPEGRTSYNVTSDGVYRIIIYAADEAGNISMRNIAVSVA